MEAQALNNVKTNKQTINQSKKRIVKKTHTQT